MKIVHLELECQINTTLIEYLDFLVDLDLRKKSADLTRVLFDISLVRQNFILGNLFKPDLNFSFELFLRFVVIILFLWKKIYHRKFLVFCTGTHEKIIIYTQNMSDFYNDSVSCKPTSF